MSFLDDLLKMLSTPAATPGAIPGVLAVVPGIGVPLGAGSSVPADRAANALKLRVACDAVLVDPRWRPDQPWPGATHCNGAAQQVANAMGCRDLDGLMASRQVAKMEATPGWVPDSAERAVTHATRGGLAFAAMAAIPHGHIVAIRPEPMEFSSTWGCLVPIVSNVGKKCERCKLSGGFLLADRPRIKFYLWGVT